MKDMPDLAVKKGPMFYITFIEFNLLAWSKYDTNESVWIQSEYNMKCCTDHDY